MTIAEHSVERIAETWAVGCADHGSYYADERAPLGGEIGCASEIAALELAIGCATDCRNRANASLRELRGRHKRALRSYLLSKDTVR